MGRARNHTATVAADAFGVVMGSRRGAPADPDSLQRTDATALRHINRASGALSSGNASQALRLLAHTTPGKPLSKPGERLVAQLSWHYLDRLRDHETETAVRTIAALGIPLRGNLLPVPRREQLEDDLQAFMLALPGTDTAVTDAALDCKARELTRAAVADATAQKLRAGGPRIARKAFGTYWGTLRDSVVSGAQHSVSPQFADRRRVDMLNQGALDRLLAEAHRNSDRPEFFASANAPQLQKTLAEHAIMALLNAHLGA